MRHDKKACNFLTTAGIDYRFHDYRVNGIDDAQLQQFIDRLGYEVLLNTRSTTWRKPSATPSALMLAQLAVIKRPVLAAPDGELLVRL